MRNYRDMFESRISAGANEKLPTTRASNHIFVVRRHGRSCKENVLKDIANLQIKRLNNCTKSQQHAQMTTHVKKKK